MAMPAWMPRRSPARPVRSHVPVLVLTAIAIGGCGTAPEVRSPPGPIWEAVPISIFQGLRQAAYDQTRDSIWLLTAPADARLPALEDKGVVLTQFRIATRDVAQHPTGIRSRTLGLGNAMDFDSRGNLWAVWDQILVRFDPTAAVFRSWRIPFARLTGDLDQDATLGMAVALAVDGEDGVWVALAGAQAVQRFRSQDETWETVSTGTLATNVGTGFGVSGDGRVAVNGLIGEPPSTRPALVILDPPLRIARLSTVVAVRVAPFDGPNLAYLDDRGHVGVAPYSGGQPTSRWIVGKAPPGAFAARDGAIWAWTVNDGRISVRRIDPLRDTLRSAVFPHREGSGPHSFSDYRPDTAATQFSIADPDIQAIVIDKRGDLWLVTSHGGSTPDRGGYEPLYRLSL